MIKAEVGVKHRPAIPKFPVLRRAKASNLVVLFVSSEFGTVLDAGSTLHEEGEHGKYFTRCTDDSYWEVVESVLLVSDE